MKFKNLLDYLNERFPFINMALFAILFVTVYSVAAFFAYKPMLYPFGWQEVLGIVATISFFFRLRVFDEVKDYDLDCINHPGRVLQSGRITLKQLSVLALAGGLIELSWSVLMGWPTLVCWLLVLGYSLLMRYEFFISSFLKKRLVLYAITHMLIMPLIILWIWSAYVPAFGLNKHYVLLAILSLLGGFSFEIARKIKTAEAERELIDSYSKSMGYKLAIVSVLIILLAGVAVQLLLLQDLQSRNWAYLLIGLLYCFSLGLYIFSMVKPKEKTLKAAEILVSLFMLLSYLSIIIEVNF